MTESTQALSLPPAVATHLELDFPDLKENRDAWGQLMRATRGLDRIRAIVIEDSAADAEFVMGEFFFALGVGVGALNGAELDPETVAEIVARAAAHANVAEAGA